MTYDTISPYDALDIKETIEEALEDLWNSRDERFRDKLISGLLRQMTKIVDEAGINRPHPYVETFTHRDLVDLGCIGSEDSEKIENKGWIVKYKKGDFT